MTPRSGAAATRRSPPPSPSGCSCCWSGCGPRSGRRAACSCGSAGRQVALLCGIVFAGRLAITDAGAAAAALQPSTAPGALDGPAAAGRQARRPGAAGRGAGAALHPGIGRYELDLGILVLTYVMLGWGLNIVVGLAGLLDLGYVAFYAVGAYSYALLAQIFGLCFWICLPLAGILAAFWGVMLGFPVLRLRGDYLAIVTLAFGEIIRVVLINWVDADQRPERHHRHPAPDASSACPSAWRAATAPSPASSASSPRPIHRVIFLYYVILGLALLTNWVTLRLRRLPLGRAWEALREDEIACRSLGINVTTTKLTAFALGAMFGGFAGAFFATRQAFISPESFTFIESAIVLAIVVLGGLGSQVGVALAALVMIGGFELFRGLDEWRMLVFGGAWW